MNTDIFVKMTHDIFDYLGVETQSWHCVETKANGAKYSSYIWEYAPQTELKAMAFIWLGWIQENPSILTHGLRYAMLWHFDALSALIEERRSTRYHFRVEQPKAESHFARADSVLKVKSPDYWGQVLHGLALSSPVNKNIGKYLVCIDQYTEERNGIIYRDIYIPENTPEKIVALNWSDMGRYSETRYSPVLVREPLK